MENSRIRDNHAGSEPTDLCQVLEGGVGELLDPVVLVLHQGLRHHLSIGRT